ncbi:hypothetical protein GCM10022222_44200 [Amycolatopsis ultiminotia]|uniref:Uncharacterized protein n=1 Tax=Amycolatopsis ultiminotia TaxID=543629 RepID=A0ABP6WSP2_9PSEU
MGEEHKGTTEQATKRGLRPASVAAAALAAVTAALLGSTLGVAGTVVGAGLASVITTVGGELYLRSLQRTRDAAKKARDKLATAGQRRTQGGLRPVSDPRDAPTVYLSTDLSEMPTVRISKLQPGESPEEQPEEQPEAEESFGAKLRKLRWPLIIGSSVVAFAAALAVLFTLDGVSNGGVNTGLLPQRDTSQQDRQQDDQPTQTQDVPTPTETPSDTPSTAPSTTTTTVGPTTTTSPTTENQAPPSSTGSSAPSTTQSQPESKAPVQPNATP